MSNNDRDQISKDSRLQAARFAFEVATCIFVAIVLLAPPFFGKPTPFDNLKFWQAVLFYIISSLVVLAFFSRAFAKLTTKKQYLMPEAERKTRGASSPTTSTVLAILSRKKAQQRQLAITFLLLATAACFAGALLSGSPLSFGPVLLLLLAAAVLQLGDAALGYRLQHSLYGTNEYEARQIISFVLAHADEIDLSGGLGVTEMNLEEATQTILESNWGVATQ